MPGLQDRPPDSHRDCCARPSPGLVMKSQARETACPRATFVEAWGDPRLRWIFRCETGLPKCGLTAAMEHDSRSGQHLPPLIPCPEQGMENKKPIQSP